MLHIGLNRYGFRCVNILSKSIAKAVDFSDTFGRNALSKPKFARTIDAEELQYTMENKRKPLEMTSVPPISYETDTTMQTIITARFDKSAEKMRMSLVSDFRELVDIWLQKKLPPDCDLVTIALLQDAISWAKTITGNDSAAPCSDPSRSSNKWRTLRSFRDDLDSRMS